MKQRKVYEYVECEEQAYGRKPIQFHTDAVYGKTKQERGYIDQRRPINHVSTNDVTIDSEDPYLILTIAVTCAEVIRQYCQYRKDSASVQGVVLCQKTTYAFVLRQ